MSTLRLYMDQIENLKNVRGGVSRTAKKLGIPPVTFWRLVNGVDKKRKIDIDVLIRMEELGIVSNIKENEVAE